MHIAVIGAGMSGVTCALGLQERGHTVVVYEKSRGVSGRMSTRRPDSSGFDHGAQYFTATSAGFQASVAAWAKAGWIAEWSPRLVELDRGTIIAKAEKNLVETIEKNPKKQRWVPQPGMRFLVEHLTEGLDVRTNQSVAEAFQEAGKWLLRIRCDSVPIGATAGPFDAVVVAVPADQAITLLAPAPDFSALAASARLAPCWTLMLKFERSLALRYDAAWVSNSPLGWIARDSSKPSRRAGENWIAHASTAWSIEHLEDSPEQAQQKLLTAFQEATKTKTPASTVMVHRWRYSQSMAPLPQSCMWDSSRLIGACGDWFEAGLAGRGRIENAFLSGSMLADLIDRSTA